MGQNQSSAEYIDVFDVNPRHPYRATEENQSDVCMRSHDNPSVVDIGHHNEESDDYSYAYSTQISRESIERLTGSPKQRSVSLKDDYSVPPDRVSVSSTGAQLLSPDYIEPYKSDTDAKDTYPHNQLEDSNSGDIYELAKDVDALHEIGPHPCAQVAGNRDGQYNHLNSAQFKFPVTSDVTKESYDHINTWQSNCNRVNIPSEIGNQKLVESKNSNSSQGASAITPMMQGPGDYQEPWDSEEGRRKLSQIMENAERKDEQRKSVSKSPISPIPAKQVAAQKSIETKVNPPVASFRTLRKSQQEIEEENTYESAWDSQNQQRKFSGILQTAENKSKCVPPVTLPKQGQAYSPSHGYPTIPADYEDAWDTPEKQKEFDEKLALARKHRASEGKISDALAGNSNVSEQVLERIRAPAEPPPRTPSPTLSPGFLRHRNKFDLISEKVARSDSCHSLGALAEKVDATIPLKDQNFYHGSIKRSNAERMLVVFKEGSYLVRKSESKKLDFSLTLKGWNGLAMHMKISCQRNGTYILGENSQPFNTVPQMVHYYTTHELPVHNAERICLLYPIPC